MAKIKSVSDSKYSIDKRQGVWFCAHADDYGTYFERVCCDIFECRDCTVFYDEEPRAEYSEEELLSKLGEMSLFAVAVTEKFLTEENRARNVELEFAKRSGIPILPIMWEAGLDELFNKKCGSYHALNAYACDAEEYKRRLKNHLSAVLIGNKLAEEIRAEFDTYVFLSYRKADKADALQLLRLIHKNDMCRDVVVWYDEYLVLGEDFNDAIKYALSKSSLFVLAVTRSITDKTVKDGKLVDNYVVSHEFPTAMAAHKKILPIRIAQISDEKLRDVFDGIPPCVNMEDNSAVSKALLQLLGDEVCTERKNTPDHDFLIGLAYLGGIDVEIDREKAFALIEHSAKLGNVRAMEKLVHMYRNGDGVPPNYGTAIEWQKRFVESLADTYAKNKSLVVGESCLNGYMTLAEYMSESGDVGGAERTYEKMLSVARSYYAALPMSYTRRFVAVAELEIAQINYARGNIPKAMKHAAASLEIRKQNAKENGYDGLSVDDLLSAIALMKNIYSACGDYENENIYLQKIRKLTKQAQKSCVTELEAADLLLQTVSAKPQREKRKSLVEALGIFEREVKRNSSPENLKRLCNCYFCLGMICYGEALKFADDPTLPQIIRNGFSAAAEKHYGSDYKMPDKNTMVREAKDYYFSAFELAKKVAGLTHAADDLRLLAKISNEIGTTLIKLSKTEHIERDETVRVYTEAGKYYDSAIAVLEDLVKLSDLTSDYALLADCLQNRAFRTEELVYRGCCDVSVFNYSLSDRLRAAEVLYHLMKVIGSAKEVKELAICYELISGTYKGLADSAMAEKYKKMADELFGMA